MKSIVIILLYEYGDLSSVPSCEMTPQPIRVRRDQLEAEILARLGRKAQQAMLFYGLQSGSSLGSGCGRTCLKEHTNDLF